MEKTCYILVSDTGFIPEDDKAPPHGVFVIKTKSFAKKLQKRAPEPLTIFSVLIGDIMFEFKNLIKTNSFTVISEIK